MFSIKPLLCAIVIYSHLAYAERLPILKRPSLHDDEPISCALFRDSTGFLYSHISFMFIGFWVLMPMGIVLNTVKSNLHVPVQVLAILFGALGLFLAKLYSYSFPRINETNTHHYFGWILFGLMFIQIFVGSIQKFSNTSKKNEPMSETKLHPTSEKHEKYLTDEVGYYLERHSFCERILSKISPDITISTKRAFETIANNRFTNVFCRVFDSIFGRLLLVFVFIQTVSGMVVYHSICPEWEVVGYIAHLIKGAAFFVYGLVTFSRYMGVFAEKGWAWNYIENGSNISFEMMECIFLFSYGIAQNWLGFFVQDSALTHDSLSFMLWWAGLLGMLVENQTIKIIIERAIPELPYRVPANSFKETSSKSDKGSQEGYSINVNPVPVMTMLMIGISIGNQEAILSSRVHSFYSLSISAVAICRIITYLALFVNPPKGSLPTRPISEFVASFLIVTCSILFVASNRETLLWLDRNGSLLSSAIIFAASAMSYVAFIFILKNWAAKREASKLMATEIQLK